ncbi:MAG TPA: hypothetical protein ACFCUD_03465 [Cyclobacteriaceae bacterium]
MIPEFENLRPEEVEIMLRAPVLVSILIAGADGNIDKREMKEAIATARSKQSRAREQLVDYYKLVGKDFDKRFQEMVKEFPNKPEDRNPLITKELRRLNRILPKLDNNFAVKFYASLKELAKKIAESSGGVLGYLSVSYEEAKLMDLKMIMDPAVKK